MFNNKIKKLFGLSFAFFSIYYAKLKFKIELNRKNPYFYEYLKDNHKLQNDSKSKEFFTFNIKQPDGSQYFENEKVMIIDQNKVKEIIEATFEIHSMCLELINEVVYDEKLLDLFEIPENLRPIIRDSWEKKETDFLGRFDFLIDKNGTPKLLEYNGDTPTLLIESGVLQNEAFRYINQTKLKEEIIEKEFKDIKKNIEKNKNKLEGMYYKYNSYMSLMNSKYFKNGFSSFKNYRINLEFIDKCLSYVMNPLFFLHSLTTKNLNNSEEFYLKHFEDKIKIRLEETFTSSFDEFNYMEKAITNFWSNVFKKNYENKQNKKILLAADKDSEEEYQTLNYVKSLMEKAENQKHFPITDTDIKNMHFNVNEEKSEIFITDKNRTNYDILWKLYPYEWLVDEEFGSLFEKYDNEGHLLINSSDLSKKENKKNVQLDLFDIYSNRKDYMKNIIANNNFRKGEVDSNSLIDSKELRDEDLLKMQNKILDESLLIKTDILEPSWKLIISSKAILPALYERYPDNKYLLPAYFDNPYKILKDPLYNADMKNNLLKEINKTNKWVVKSLYGREGFDVKVVDKSKLESQSLDNNTTKEAYFSNDLHDKRNPNITHHINNAIYQSFSESVLLDDNFITIGSWTVNGTPAGFTVRETKENVLNDDNSHFVPHMSHMQEYALNINFKTFNELQRNLRWDLYGDEWEQWLKIYDGKFLGLLSTIDGISNVKGGTGGSGSTYINRNNNDAKKKNRIIRSTGSRRGTGG